MTDKMKGVLAAMLAVAGLGVGGAAVAGAVGGGGQSKSEQPTAELDATENESAESESAEDGAEGPDEAITGAALDKASAAALEHVGEGEVSDTEVGDEESLYEVEVTRDDGSQIDVQLDAGFNVVGDEEEGAGEE